MSNDGYYDESLPDEEVMGAGFHEVDEDTDFLDDDDEYSTPKKKSSSEDDEDLDDLLAGFDDLPEDEEDPEVL